MPTFLGRMIVAATLMLAATDASAIPTEVTPQCPASESVCVVVWNLTQVETMMIYEDGLAYPVVFTGNSLEKRTSCDNYEAVNIDLGENVNQNSGVQKFVYAVNNNSPGGTLAVYENQTLEIRVYNSFVEGSTGIHWHGMYQRGTPYMDGVTSVTQCPINLQETFVYRFKPEPDGTHWYHSHTALQRSDGLFGAMIILPVQERTGLPTFDKDFVAVFHDWFQPSGVENYYSTIYGFSPYLKNGFSSDICADYSVATIINGIGYLGTDEGSLLGATTYEVTQGRTYRMRFLNSGLLTAYLIQIEQHVMTVIASDGRPMEPFTTSGLVVHIGERYDVYFTADKSVSSYWITFTKLSETGIETGDHSTGYAILYYTGADSEVEPTSQPNTCTEDAPCRITNCPFQAFDDQSLHYECTNVGDLRSTESVLHEGDIEEHFLVFGFTESIQGTERASVNAIHYTVPSKPPQVFREVDFDRDCDQYDCANEACLCTHMIKVTLGKVIQMVFASSSQEAHPIHMHGHDYQIIKVVYGTATSGVNPDIDCQSDNPNRCTNPTWTDPSWLGGNVPDIITDHPPEKDTVIVPGGGYVVIRIMANNPGWWMLHCHIEFHLEEGMGLIMQEGEESDMPEVPVGFPTCGSFNFDQGLNSEVVQATTTANRAVGTLGGGATGLLMVLVAGALAIVAVWPHCIV